MTWNGLKKTVQSVPPVAVYADSNIFAEAPKRLTSSGVSDLLGKYICLLDWKIAHMLTDEYICDEIIKLEEKAMRTVRSCLADISEGDKESCEKLMYALILSGLATQMARAIPDLLPVRNISFLICGNWKCSMALWMHFTEKWFLWER